MSVHQAKLDLAHGKLSLPNWNGTGVPPADFIVARADDGTVVSHYGDIIWYIGAYHAYKKPTQLTFAFWDSKQIPSADESARAEELRWLLFLLMWCRPIPLSVQSLKSYVSHLRKAARFAVVRGVSLQTLLGSETLLQASRRVLHPADLKVLNSLLSFLYELGAVTVGFSVAVGDALTGMKADVIAYQGGLKQHPPLPTRIYSSLLATVQSELYIFGSILDEAIDYAVLCAGNKARDGQNFTWPVLPDKLSAYLRRCGFLDQPRGVIGALKCAQFLAKLQIQAFSGMRDLEAQTLQYNCLDEMKVDGITHKIIRGSTTKLNRGRLRKTKWVTSRQGSQAIEIVRRIANSIYGFLGAGDIESLPLFVSTSYLAIERRAFKWNGTMPRLANLNFAGAVYEHFQSALCPIIEDQDLRELEHIDPHRAWRSEPKFALGVHWTLTTHQLRRSLALYAQRSGLVSLPSLKRQLQHITEEMSRYYARGSAFAIDFLNGQQDHVGHEWQATQPVSSALSYMQNVLYSDEVLFGGHVQWVERNLRDNDVLRIDRETTLRRFKKGELSYRETILGGCTSIDGCKSSTINIFDIDCVAGCKNLVGRLSSLERVIAVQTRFVAALEPGSIEHNTEAKDLKILQQAHKQVTERKIA